MDPSRPIPSDETLHTGEMLHSGQIADQHPGLSQQEAARRVIDIYARTQARVRIAEAEAAAREPD